jgi:hypothetical protein
MPIVVPNESAGYLTIAAIGKLDTTPLTMVLRLYTNNYTPVPGSHVADFTEATFTGYAAVTLNNSLWGSPTIVSDRGQTIYDSGTPVPFVSSGGSPQTIYGYFLENTDAGVVWFAEKFATARTVNPGDTLDLTLVFTGGTQ